jgi:glutamate-ammonia-ligase adenylyltransferase
MAGDTGRTLGQAPPDRDQLQHMVDRLGDEHRRSFPPEVAAEHVQRLLRLSRDNPVELILHDAGDGGVCCTILAFDRPFMFSLITGVLFGTGVTIEAGEVFTADAATGRARPAAATAAPDPNPTRDAVFIDHFRGRLVDRDARFDDWAATFTQRLREAITQATAGDEAARQRAHKRVGELVTQRLKALHDTPDRVMPPMQFTIEPTGRGEMRVRIVGSDTPAFLYTLSTALSLSGLDIRRVRIDSDAGSVSDTIELLDRRPEASTDPATLDRVRVCVLLTKQFTYFLGQAPDPQAALTRFNRLVDDVLRASASADPSAAVDWVSLLHDSNAMRGLARVLGASDYLWEDFIRGQYESLLPLLQPGEPLVEPLETLPKRLLRSLDGAVGLAQQRDRLNAFKDRELFRIDLAHVLDPAADFRQLSERLTMLAENLVAAATRCVYDDLVRSYGQPRYPVTGGSTSAVEGPGHYAVFGLGKLGGAALGYASDIELLLVYPGDAEATTTGGKRAGITHGEFFETLAQETASFLRTRREGIFEVDLRLRPYGNDGPLAVSCDAFERYYDPRQPPYPHAFERLALVRLRWIAGDPALGFAIEQLRDRFVYDGPPLDLDELWSLWARQREQKLGRSVPAKRFRPPPRPDSAATSPPPPPMRDNAKHSPGGLADLETAIMLLQVINARSAPQLRTAVLSEAMTSLHRAGVLTPDEFDQLSEAYQFLRRLINGLRMLRGNARDLFLPDEDDDEFVHLARRMRYPGSASQLADDWRRHTRVVCAFIETRFNRPTPAPGNLRG